MRQRRQGLAQYRPGVSVKRIARRAFLGTLPGAAALWGQARPASSHLIWLGALSKEFLLIDEATEKVIDRVPLQTGVPRGVRLSYDKKKLYVFTPMRTGIEIIDLAARKVTSSFPLSEADRNVRTRGYAPDPQDRLLYTIFSVAVKKIDRFEIEKPKFGVIDLAEKKIVRAAELPKDEPRLGQGAELRVTPDGKHLYAFGENVLIFDTSDFKLVEKIELSKPLYPGVATIGLGIRDEPMDDRNEVVGVFNSTDPIVRRRIFGIARFDLIKKTFDFTPLGPAAGGMGGLQVTPDGKTGYTVAFQGEHGNRRSEFWVFDMESRNVARRLEFDGPINFNFTLSSNGRLIYIHGSAPFMEVYDAATLERRRVIDFHADKTTRLLILPRSA